LCYSSELQLPFLNRGPSTPDHPVDALLSAFSLVVSYIMASHVAGSGSSSSLSFSSRTEFDGSVKRFVASAQPLRVAGSTAERPLATDQPSPPSATEVAK